MIRRRNAESAGVGIALETVEDDVEALHRLYV